MVDFFITHSILFYHPLACDNQICIDISGGSEINGRLINGSCLRLYPFSQSLLSLGGCSLVYSLIELFQENDDNIIKSPNINKNSKKFLFEQLNFNPIASIIYLIRCILSSTSKIILVEQITKHHNIEILGKYLNRISSFLIDQQFLISIEQLIDLSRSIDSSYLLTGQLIQYILLDFNIWNKATYHIRILHLQYISKIIRNDKQFNRLKYGIQFFLDTLREHFEYDRDFVLN